MSNKQPKPEIAIASREEEREELLELNDRLEAYGKYSTSNTEWLT